MRPGAGFRALRGAIVGVVIALVAASAASAATVPVTIGSDLSAASDSAQNCPTSGCTQGLIQLGGQNITAPCTGMVTSWAIRGSTFATSGTDDVKLRVLHPAGGTSYTGAGTSTAVTLTTTDAVHSAMTNLPITQGDVIGLDVPDNKDYTLNSGPSGAKTSDWIPEVADGSTASPSFSTALELNIQATIACPGSMLSVGESGPGSGTVQAADDSINCPGTCSHTYTPGTQVTLTATATPGSTFAGWSGGGCSGTGTCTVTMSADQSVTATFGATNSTLTVSKAGSGSGTVTSGDGGIDCGSSCSHSYATGTPVTLTATPGSGSMFAGWSGGGCSGTGTCVVTMSADQTVTASFARGAALSGLSVRPRSFSLAGRKVKGKCVKPTRKNNGDPHCNRPIKLVISYTLSNADIVTFTLHGKTLAAQSGKAGANSFSFNGKIGGHTLAPGTYRLTATPTGGQPQTASFKITA